MNYSTLAVFQSFKLIFNLKVEKKFSKRNTSQGTTFKQLN